MSGVLFHGKPARGVWVRWRATTSNPGPKPQSLGRGSFNMISHRGASTRVIKKSHTFSQILEPLSGVYEFAEVLAVSSYDLAAQLFLLIIFRRRMSRSEILVQQSQCDGQRQC